MNKTSKILIASIILSSSILNVSHASKITISNWLSHPEILEVRKIYNRVEILQKDKKLTSVHKTQECDEANVVIEAKLFSDTDENTRKYLKEGGTEDSAFKRIY